VAGHGDEELVADPEDIPRRIEPDAGGGDGNADAAVDVLARGDAALEMTESDVGVREDVVGAASAIRQAARRGDATAALDQLDRHRLLCAHRTGPFGVDSWSRTIERWLADVPGDPREGEWYVGRPLLVTVNDYALGLYNVFDWRYSLPVSPEFRQDMIVQNGRTLLASASVTF